MSWAPPVSLVRIAAWSLVAGGQVFGSVAPARAIDADALIEAARSHVRARWETEVKPLSESALAKIDIHAVERRSRLAPGEEIHLVHAFAEASWWKASEHYLLLVRPAETGFEVLYSFRGGAGGKGIEYRLVDLGSAAPRFALEISDHGFGTAVSGTVTHLVLYLPESGRFAEVFREITSYWPPASHTFRSTLSQRRAEGPIKQVVVRTSLYKAGDLVDTVESIFEWQGASYRGLMPLPRAWRAELP